MNYKETLYYRINQHKAEIEYLKKRDELPMDKLIYLQGRLDAFKYAIKEYERN